MRNAAGKYIASPEEVIAAAAADPNSAYGKALAASQSSPPQPVAETPSDVVNRLEGELRDLESQMDTVSSAAKTGDLLAVRGCDLTGLTIRAAQLRGELDAARKAVADTDFDDRQQLCERQKRDFEQATEQARQARSEFKRTCEDAAKALGRWCESTRQAILLNNKLRGSFPLPDVERVNQLRDLEDRSLLLPQLVAGFRLTMDFGFDLQIPVVPWIKK